MQWKILPNDKSIQTDKLSKDITETLTSLKLDVKAPKEKQSRQSSWEKRGNDIGRNKKETQNKIVK